MTRERFVDPERDSVHEAAADWFVRLQDPGLSLDDTLGWQSWMSADEHHAQAFHRIEEAWNRFRGLPRPPLGDTETLAADRYDGSMPVSGWLAGSQKAATPRRLPSLRRFALAATIATIALGATLALHFNRSTTGEPVTRTVIETDIGESRRVRLADGSTVALGGHTRLEVSMSARERQLALGRGEAFFDVARDTARPFSVRAGSATVTALGTQFNVRRADDRVTVAVIEGRVLVEPRLPLLQQLPLLRETASKRRQPHRLEAGDQSMLDDGGLESSVQLADSSAATAWQSGRLTFEREPLRYALESVNRYSRKPIVLGDEHLGDLRITGTARSDNIAGWVSSLESAFGLAAIEEPEHIVLRSASSR